MLGPGAGCRLLVAGLSKWQNGTMLQLAAQDLVGVWDPAWAFSGAMPLCGILANPYASLRACEEQEALPWLGFQVHAESMVEM